MRLNSFTRLLALLLCIALLGSAAMAQTSKGTVTGNVTDPTGAVVPGATVTITNIATNVVRTAETTSAGLFRFDAVDLGDYNISVSATGFATSEVKGVPVRANQNTAVDFAMKVGSKEQVVEVQAAGAMVTLQTEEQLRGANIDTRAIRDLPISGQNSLNLMTTVPGIIPSNNGVADSGVGSVNGSRTRANTFLIDGVDNNDISVAGPAITMSNNDAIQEVSIQTANYSAEFGRTGGAVVNQITKSGTNQFHGTAAWVYLSETLNASTRAEKRRYAARTSFKQPKDVYLENIPAFTVGGPIIKDKTFFFVAGQWDKYRTGAASYGFYVPDAAGLATLQGYAGACPNVALYLQAINGLTAISTDPAQGGGRVSLAVPAGNTTCNGDLRTGVSINYGIGYRSVAQPYNGFNTQARVDHVFSQKQQINFRFWKDTQTQPNIAGGAAISDKFDADYNGTNYIGGITHTYVLNNTTTNELRANYIRMSPTWTLVTPSGVGLLPTFSWGAASSNMSGFGTSANYPQGRTANTYQLQDTMAKVIGTHQLRFGGEYFRQIARQSAPINARGAVAYAQSGSGATLISGFANFMDDFSGPGNGRVGRQYGTPIYHPTLTSWAFFFQDSWKVTPTFTLNYGIRYDYFGQPANIFKYPMANFDPAAFSTAKIPTDKNNWGPSIGFAWAPRSGWFSDGKTVVRGGFQIGYDRWFNNLLSNMAAGAPNNVANVPVNCAGTCGNGTNRGLAGLYSTYYPAMTSAAMLPVVNGIPTDTSSQFPGNIRNPYTERWSLGVQHELPWNMLTDISYVGSASHKLFQQQQLNPNATPNYNALTGVYTLNPVRLNPSIGSRMVRASTANSNYHAMQASLTKRMTNTVVGGLQFTSAFTWAKALGVVDEVFNTYASGVYMSANPLLYNGNRLWDYGPSDNDRRWRLVSTAVWDVKGPKSGWLGQVAGGWSLSTVLPLQAATPFTVFNGVDRDLDGTNLDRPDIGNVNAALNTYAQKVPTTTCSTGWQAPNVAWTPTPIPGPCVNPSDVHWLYYPTGSYSPTNANTDHRNSLRTKTGSVLMNMNVIKRFKVREGVSFEARAEIFNIFNHRNFNYVPANTSVSAMFARNNTSKLLDYGSASDPGHRTMRIGAKITF